MGEDKFIIRVYGIYVNQNNHVLVSDELVYGMQMTKFPGGGLEYGEGLIECLERELKEETGHAFRITDHFYTTDFFVASAFHSQKQVISVYYLVQLIGEIELKISIQKFDFDIGVEVKQSFRWVELAMLVPEEFTFPADQHVARILISQYN